MSWSIGETRALVIKAARGAGMDWGMAQEAGFALEWLEQHNVPATQALAEYLSLVSEQMECDYQHCPLKLGTFISDIEDFTQASGQSIYSPILLAPFIALSIREETVKISWGEHHLVVSNESILMDEKLQNAALIPMAVPVTVSVEIVPKNNIQVQTKTRVEASAEPHIEVLTQLAHKTYAPATEASRLAGAGAGLNDND